MDINANKVEQLITVINELKSQSDIKDKMINEMAKELEAIRESLNKPCQKPERTIKNKVNIDIYNEIFDFDINASTGEFCGSGNEKTNRNFHVFIKNLMLVCGHRYASFRNSDQKYVIYPKSQKMLSEKEFENFSTLLNKILGDIYDYKVASK